MLMIKLVRDTTTRRRWLRFIWRASIAAERWDAIAPAFHPSPMVMSGRRPIASIAGTRRVATSNAILWKDRSEAFVQKGLRPSLVDCLILTKNKLSEICGRNIEICFVFL